MQAGTDWRKFSRRYSRERFNNLSIKLMNDGSLSMHENGQMRWRVITMPQIYFTCYWKWFKDIPFSVITLENVIWGDHVVVIRRHQKAYTKFNHKHKRYWNSSFRDVSLGMLLFVAWRIEGPKDTHTYTQMCTCLYCCKMCCT